MNMDIHSESLPIQTGNHEIQGLRGELEQARVALEDMDHRLAELAIAHDELQQRLADETRRRELAERQLRDLKASMAATSAAPDEGDALRQQLSTALEELHVMTEELSVAQDALREATCRG